MHPDLVARIFHDHMTTLVGEAKARRARQTAKGVRPSAKRSAITSNVTQ